MPRPKNIDPPTSLYLMLPETVRARIDLLLFSEIEGRVPHGKYQEFFLDRIRDYFDNRRLHLHPWGISGTVSAPQHILDELERKLNG